MVYMYETHDAIYNCANPLCYILTELYYIQLLTYRAIDYPLIPMRVMYNISVIIILTISYSVLQSRTHQVSKVKEIIYVTELLIIVRVTSICGRMICSIKT